MKKKRPRLTMLDVVRTVQDHARCDEEVVAVIAHLFGSRRVILSEKPARRRIAAVLGA